MSSMLGLGVATAIAVVGFGLIVRQWQRGTGAPAFVLGALPFALPLVTIPLSIGAWRIGDVFRELGESPLMGPADAAARFAALSHETRAALILCAALLTTTAGLQLVTTLRGSRKVPVSPEGNASQIRDWRRWFPALAATLLAPVISLSRMVRELPVLILGPMLDAAAGGTATSDAMVALGAVGDASLLITSRVHTTVWVGTVTTIALIAAGIINTRALSTHGSAPSGLLALLVFIAVVMFLAWSAVALTADIRMLEALTR